jgi:hypothetical protein
MRDDEGHSEDHMKMNEWPESLYYEIYSSSGIVATRHAVTSPHAMQSGTSETASPHAMQSRHHTPCSHNPQKQRHHMPCSHVTTRHTVKTLALKQQNYFHCI